ncbi:MAG: hypothetical protein M1836_005436 [Candelina mexicana]|nr:MAG: hypothetical protein M1836_005436 [Candelina mexicana]
MHTSFVKLALVATAATAVVAAPNYLPWSSLSKESFTIEVPKPTLVTDFPFKEPKSTNSAAIKSVKSEFFTKSIITVVKPTIPVSFKPKFTEPSGTESKTAAVYNRFFEPEPSFSVKTIPFFPFKTTIIAQSQATSSPQSQTQSSNNGQATKSASQSVNSNQSQTQSSNNSQSTKSASQKTVTFKKPFFPFPTGFF